MVSALHQTNPQSCLAMTYSGYIGLLLEPISTRDHPAWWMQSRYSKTFHGHGSAFCPKCLAEDQEPYFRLSWRFGFSTVCARHKILLHDTCPQCGKAPWPSACGIHKDLSASFSSMRMCPYCDFDLSTTEQFHPTSPTILDSLLEDQQPLIHLFDAPCLEGLATIRTVCRLFLRNRARGQMLDSQTPWSDMTQRVSADGMRFNMIEAALVADRHLVISAALEICKEWPESFLRFCEETGISKFHFYESAEDHPSWLSELINDSLAQPKRTVTKIQVLEAFNRLTSRLGHIPSRYQLRKELQYEGSKWFDEIYAAAAS